MCCPHSEINDGWGSVRTLGRVSQNTDLFWCGLMCMGCVIQKLAEDIQQTAEIMEDYEILQKKIACVKSQIPEGTVT